jgi:hypothetical protein
MNRTRRSVGLALIGFVLVVAAFLRGWLRCWEMVRAGHGGDLWPGSRLGVTYIGGLINLSAILLLGLALVVAALIRQLWTSITRRA